MKSKYVASESVELVGVLDYDQDDKMVVMVEMGHGDNVVIHAVDLMNVLEAGVGKEISLKLVNTETL